MTSKQKQQLEQVIREKMDQTRLLIDELEELTKPIPLDASIGRISRMDAINNKTINEASLREKKNLMKKLERALEQLPNKDYGLCTRCGDEIPFGRLEYMPYTTRCVQCVG